MEYISALKLILNGRKPTNSSFHVYHCKVFKEDNIKWGSFSAIITGALVIV